MKPGRRLFAVITLMIFALIALATGFSFIYGIQYGNPELAPGEVQWFRGKKANDMIAEGFSPEEAKRHAYVFGYFYTLAKDVEYANRRSILAYSSFSVAVMCTLAACILSAARSDRIQGAVQF